MLRRQWSIPSRCGDKTGLIESIGIVKFEFFPDLGPELELSNSAVDVIEVTWWGGACDNGAMFEVARLDGSLVLGYDLGEGCVNQQAAPHGFEIRFTEPVLAENIAVRPRPAAGL